MNRFKLGIMRAIDSIRCEVAEAIQWPVQNVEVWINADGVKVKASDNAGQCRYIRCFDVPPPGTRPDSIENALDWYRGERLLRQVESLLEDDGYTLSSLDDDYFEGIDN